MALGCVYCPIVDGKSQGLYRALRPPYGQSISCAQGHSYRSQTRLYQASVMPENAHSKQSSRTDY